MSEEYGEQYLYLRYCDDMVIIHKSPLECKKLFDTYLKSLEDISLVYHNAAELNKYNSKKFWKKNVKTRDVYVWSKRTETNLPHSPWLSFLGYMIYVNGDLKIRKKSIEKQHQKHVDETKKIIKKLNKHSNEELLRNEIEIVRSFESRLYSMAVGKVDIGKYKTMPPKMCWGAGFKLIEDNKFIRSQLKKLDRSQKIEILILKKYIYRRLSNYKFPTKEGNDDGDDRNIIEFHYPFSFKVYLQEAKQKQDYNSLSSVIF